MKGPVERLNTTLYTRPILFIVSVAVSGTFQSDPIHRVGAQEGIEGTPRTGILP